MLKRYQILLTDWLAEYINFLAQRYDVSFSEVVRLALCVEFMHQIPLHCPEFKPKITRKDLLSADERAAKAHSVEEKHHSLMSKIYFEGRKAIEYRLNKEKKSKPNP